MLTKRSKGTLRASSRRGGTCGLGGQVGRKMAYSLKKKKKHLGTEEAEGCIPRRYAAERKPVRLRARPCGQS